MIILFSLVFNACDSVTIDYTVGKCMENGWFYKGLYKIDKKEKLKVYMKGLNGQEDIVISAMDKGWKESECFAENL